MTFHFGGMTPNPLSHTGQGEVECFSNRRIKISHQKLVEPALLDLASILEKIKQKGMKRSYQGTSDLIRAGSMMLYWHLLFYLCNISISL